MKKLRVVLIGGLMINVLALGQTQQTATGNTVDVPSPTPCAVVSQDANSKVWEWTTYEALPSGQVVSHLHHYTELATGLSYQQNGQWVDSQEQINIQPDGTASATAGQHQAYFPSDIGNGTLTLVTPDGLQLQSQPLGLFYDDGSNTVMLAELTNSVGQLISPNQIIYTNAFTGLDADLLYTYTKAGFEQDVILNEQPQSPEAYGLNPQTAQLQMLTEFFNPPQPAVTAVQLPEQAGVALSDDTLGFGTMKMVPGRAFLLGANADDGQVMVGKQWLLVGGRQFLAESVPVGAIANQLAQMPAVQISSISSKSPLNVVSATRLLPPHRLAQKTNTHPKRIAEAKIPKKGLILDYQTDNSSQTNVIFRGDTTYYISSTVDLFGTNTFEGGTVIKYATNGCIYQTGGNIEWNANAYNPVIFTAKDDNTVGQAITGSTGNPTNYYANPEALGMSELLSTSTISYFRISHAVQAISITTMSDPITLYHGQIVNCQQGISATYCVLNVGNLLFANVQTNFLLGYGYLDSENVTFNNSSWLIGYFNSASAGFENCIFANVTNLTNNVSAATFSGDVNGFYNSPPFGVVSVTSTFYPFQTVGAGGYYLTNGCQFRSNGITAIDSELLAELAQKTTYPPVVFSNTTIPYATNFMPQAQRDNNGTTVDLGYHYDPIDYAFGGVSASTNLSFSAGTVMGWFELPGSDGDGYGIALRIGSTVTFNGTAASPCFEARYDTVQEGGNGLWKDLGSLGGIVANGNNGSSASFASGVNAQFTHFMELCGDPNDMRDDTSAFILHAKHCEFWSGSQSGYGIFDEFTNCLLNATIVGVEAAASDVSSLVMENCTMREAHIFTDHESGSTWPVWIQNSAYEGTDMSQMDNPGTNIYCNYNAFLTRTNHLTDEGLNTVVVTNGYNWESSWFGNYYLPTNSLLIHNGNTNANALGLYWFTTQTNQTINGTNKVDIGYHYVAADTNGNPLEYSFTNIPNYILYPDGPPTNLLEIVTNPASETVMQGSNATFSVTAVGASPLSYQWYWNGAPLSDGDGVSGSANATLSLSGVQPFQAGNYYVVVANDLGFLISTDAVLAVVPSQTYDSAPLYLMPPYIYWNVTDISDPGQPVDIGELQEPFTEPLYVPGTSSTVPPLNTPWHTNTTVIFTEAYGTTAVGGNGYGTVFKIDPDGPLQGNQPNELALSGNTLYGTTAGLGGTSFHGYGTIFSINTSGSGFTNIYSFNLPSGAQPEAGLVLSESILYGTTESGGNGFGTVFSFDTTNGGYATLYSFTGPDNGDGANPLAKLVLYGNTLYGATSSGGTHNKGAIFEINADGSGGYQLLHNFAGQAEGDGASPEAALILSGSVLYGTTESGGAYGLGTVFSFNTNDNVYTVLHSFKGDESDGNDPEGGLVISGSTLYGTTAYGGTNFAGTVFSINTGGTNFTILHSFDDSNTNDGATPYAGLVLSGDTLYGTTAYGGNNDFGTAFSINISGNGYTNLYSFQDGADGSYPATALVLSNNTLFGTTPGDSSLVGDPNSGTIFSINTNGSDFTVLNTFSTFGVIHTFNGTNDGANPCSQLAISGSAFYGIPTTVYGTTSGGGTNGYGTVFKVNTDGTGFADLYDFGGTNDGKYPQTGLLIDGNTLYGTTTNSIFKINTDGSDFTCLTNINGASQLILWLSGNKLFGTMSSGGDDNYGSVFSINTDGSGFTNIYSFPGGSGGEFPKSGLELYGVGSFIANGPAVGTLYGTTYSGGAYTNGMVFSINTDGSDFADLHDFGGTSDGANPVGGLLITNNNLGGNSGTYLFGTTSSGGTNDAGTVFGMAVGGGPDTPVHTLYSFGGAIGAGTQPEGKLALLGQVLCGTTSGGGAYSNGMAFTINANGSGFTDIYDFSGGNDGGSPLAGLTLPVADNLVSIWSVDTAINVSAENVTNLIYSIAMDNYDALFVNGTLVNWTNHQGGALWSPYLPMPNLHQGENDIRLVIGGDGDGSGNGPGDYFTMTVKSTATGVVFTNNVFGTTSSGGFNSDGTIFEVTPKGYEIGLYSFSGKPDGANPIGDLVLSSNMLYGVTQNGGFTNDGAIFSFSIGSTNEVILYSFGTNPMIADGQTPKAGLLLISNTLYGTTSGSEANGNGIIFKINTDGSGYTNLHSFDDTDNNDGANPQAPLLLIGTNLYGTTYSGGNNGDGIIFSICTNGSGYTNLYSFTGGQPDGANPQAGLLLVSNIFLYGTTYSGGSNYDGTIFSFTIGGTQDAILYNFTNTPDGANPQAGLLLVSNTFLYGTTYKGGSYNDGAIFSIGVNGNGYSILQSFGSFDGENPQADLIIQGNSLYGTTSSGGAYGYGNVFGINANGTEFNDIYDFMGSPAGDGANSQSGLCSP